jgi:hypothetical protein
MHYFGALWQACRMTCGHLSEMLPISGQNGSLSQIAWLEGSGTKAALRNQ